MKIVAILLATMIVLAQFPLWTGKGGWLQVMEMNQQVSALQAANHDLQTRNTVLEAEVNNLKKGLDAIEELARSELGMIRKDEMFFHVVEYERKH
ncbi:cell division protein FtsB [Nitrosomonas halophila]|uniref:Cell division protein FtsB n=1 Tax=Nitrosomonas halophila TaxID=44576 RepID=A0A1H3LI22_9PROT|nr:cell division protein FtsB [Nitrosomonas halophila]SDY63608.1 cell division protein FtsB [Nitrosomonas halophila]HRQ04784.1 cell division protein FtsB [Nitrosomonas halophila]